MKRIIDVSQNFLDFNKKPILTHDGKQERELVLRDVLLTYIVQLDGFVDGFNNEEVALSLSVGALLGGDENKVEFTTKQHSLLLKLSEQARDKRNRADQFFFNPVVRTTAYDMVDSADVVKEEAKAKEA